MQVIRGTQGWVLSRDSLTQATCAACPLVVLGEMLAFMMCAGMESAFGIEYQPGPQKKDCEGTWDRLSREERMALRGMGLEHGNRLPPRQARAFMPHMDHYNVSGIEKVSMLGVL